MGEQETAMEKVPQTAFDVLRKEEDLNLYALARIYSQTDIVPRELQGKPANTFLVLKLGQELDVPEMQALQNIMVVNGRPSVWGDLFLALIQRDKEKYEWHREWYEGDFPNDNFTAICEIKRKGIEKPFCAEFSIEDAKRAKLWTKAGPWTAYPKRMLKMRARGFCGRDGFADSLKGVTSREEALDTQPREVKVEIVPPKTGALPEPAKARSRTAEVREKLAAEVDRGHEVKLESAREPESLGPDAGQTTGAFTHEEEPADAPPPDPDVPEHLRGLPAVDRRTFDSVRNGLIAFAEKHGIGPKSDEYPPFAGFGVRDLRSWWDAVVEDPKARPWIPDEGEDPLDSGGEL